MKSLLIPKSGRKVETMIVENVLRRGYAVRWGPTVALAYEKSPK